MEKIKKRVEHSRKQREKRKADEKRHTAYARNWSRWTFQTDAFIPRRERTYYEPLTVSRVPNTFQYRLSEQGSQGRRNARRSKASTSSVKTASVTGVRGILKRPSVGADEPVGDVRYLGTGEVAVESAEDN